MNEQFQREYDALKNGAALQLRPDAGVLVLGGDDRSDFLQRMTTNDIKRLKVGQSAVTVLTSPTARTLFVFTVLCRENDLLLLPAMGQTSTLERHLRGNIFFMDKVTVRNESTTWQRARLMGPVCAGVLADLSPTLPSVDNQWQEIAGMVLLNQQIYDLPGYELLINNEDGAVVLQKLQDAARVMLSEPAAYTARRIELGRPLPGMELTSDFTPLESGLAWACAENKGCYTGQEIIARQITYDKVTRTLVQLSSTQPLPTAITLMADGKEAGVITSALPQTDFRQALAIVRRPYHMPGSLLTVDGIQTTVVELAA